MTYELRQSIKPDKKFQVLTPDGRTIYFGSQAYEDYTIHHDPKRRMNYIARHSVREDWTDLNKPGTWSRYILWEKTSLPVAIKNMEKLFGIKIVFKK